MGQRLLAIDMFACAQRQDRDIRVEMVRRSAQDCINSLLLLQHDPKILILRAMEVRRVGLILLLDPFARHRTPAISFVVELFKAERLRRVSHGYDLRILLTEERLKINTSLSSR